MKPQVMIIDDSAEQLELMSSVFEMVDPNCEVTTARGGEEALSQLRSDSHQKPKVILLDLRMPGKNGHEVLEEIKNDSRLKKIPVCVFSNGDLQKDICDCYEKGASFYFTKPAGLEELREFVNSFNTIWFKIASHCH